MQDATPIGDGRVRRARRRGRCGVTHPGFPHVPCMRPLGHSGRYAGHGSRGWDGRGRKGLLYWYDGGGPARFIADDESKGREA